MRTHDLAKALSKLARVLRSGENVDLDELSFRADRHDLIPESEEIALSLSTLAGLSRIDKKQWAALIDEYGLPITVRPRDASRDIVGKLLTYLESNPDALRILRNVAARRRPAKASEELLKALDALLK